jgi:hypothetical protein
MTRYGLAILFFQDSMKIPLPMILGVRRAGCPWSIPNICDPVRHRKLALARPPELIFRHHSHDVEGLPEADPRVNAENSRIWSCSGDDADQALAVSSADIARMSGRYRCGSEASFLLHGATCAHDALSTIMRSQAKSGQGELCACAD